MAYKIWSHKTGRVPTVFLHSFVGDGEDVWQACEGCCPEFNLVSIHDLPMDDVLTPWPAPGIRRGQESFGGKAELYLDFLLNKTILDIENQLSEYTSYYILTGYSLAGLFALWAGTRTSFFTRLGCVSASFWYPDLQPYLQEHPLSPEIERVYFSLGDKESRTRHPLMCKINDFTDEIVHWTKAQNIPCQFDLNPGNHFTEPAWRMAKAINWLLQT